MSTWYYEYHGEQRGPVSDDELRTLMETGTVTPQTNVWKDGMADWQPARTVLDFPAASPGATMPPAASGFAAPTRPPTPAAPAFTSKVENHLVKAVLATVFCCLPLGVVAIVFAAQVDGKARAGDVAEAQRLSDEAAKWTKWAFIVGLVVYGLYAAFSILAFLSGGGY